MIPHHRIIIEDRALHPSTYAALSKMARGLPYVTSKYGGMEWPCTCPGPIGTRWKKLLWLVIEDVIDAIPVPVLSFFRYRDKSIEHPTHYHTDEGVAQWSALLMMSDPPASIQEYPYGLQFPDDGVAVGLRSNRLIIFPSHLVHGMPREYGFGLTAADSRLTWTGFFNIE